MSVKLTDSEIRVILNCLPKYNNVPKGMLPMFYLTGDYRNDLEVMRHIKSAREKLSNELS